MIPTIFLALVLSDIAAVQQQWQRCLAEPAGTHRLVQEARVLFYWGETDPNVKREKWIEGREKAEEARKLSPEDPGALLWWTANAGAIARTDKNLAALKRIKEIETVLITLKEKHSQFGFHAADRVLGKIYQEAPRFISIGSTSKAEAHLRSAIAGSPDFPGNRLGWIEFLVADERWEEARKEIALLKQRGWDGELGDFELEKSKWPDRLAHAERALSENLK